MGVAALLTKSGFDKLKRREKITIIAGGIFVICFLLLQFVFSPYLQSSRKLDSSIAKKKQERVELQLLQQEYRSLKNETGGIRDQLAKRPANFSLFSFLDARARDAGIKDYINYMKPSLSEGEDDLQESTVEMKLIGISLEQIVEYLKVIESPQNLVSVKRISIQESSKDAGLLEVVMQVVTFMMEE